MLLVRPSGGGGGGALGALARAPSNARHHDRPLLPSRGELPVRLELLGVRGSTAAPGPEFVRYGGHTSCVAVTRADGERVPSLVLDAGTGLRTLTSAPGRPGVPRLGAAEPPALGPRAGPAVLLRRRPGRRAGRPVPRARSGRPVRARPARADALPTRLPDPARGAARRLDVPRAAGGRLRDRGLHRPLGGRLPQGRPHLRAPRRARRGVGASTCPTTPRPPGSRPSWPWT